MLVESGSQPTFFPYLIGIIILVLLIVVLIFVLRHFLRKMNKYDSSFNRKTLLVLLPKESASEEQKERTQEVLIQNIGVAETFFSSIGGLKAQKGLKTFFFGRSDHFSFEIVSDQGLIHFYLTVAGEYQRYIEQQIHAQYPAAVIEEVEDYNCFEPDSKIFATTLSLKRSHIFPIKTYRHLESDPQNALTNVLSKMAKPDSAIIQYVIRSARPSWHQRGKRVTREVTKGKSFSEAVKIAKSNSFVKGARDFVKAIPKSQKPGELNKEPEQKRLTQTEEEALKGIEEKNSKAGFDVNIRIIVDSNDEVRSKQYLNDIANTFAQYNIYENGNAFRINTPKAQDPLIHDFIFRNFDKNKKLLLNTEEMTSLFHFPLPTTETPNIKWLTAKKASAPNNVPPEGLLLGENIYRGVTTNIYIKDADRRRHIYVIGKTGTGKSHLMGNMARQDVQNGKGVCIIDPHGDFVQDVLEAVPKERADDVIYFAPAEMDRPLGLNLLEYDQNYPEQKTFLINELLKIFDTLYDLKATGGPMFEQYMRNAMLLIMDDPESGSTLVEISRVLADEKFRHFKLSKSNNDVVKHFWKEEAEKAGGEASLANMVPYITSKLNAFVANDMMRPIIGQQKSAFNFREVMDEGKILLLNLSKGRLGDLNSYLIGMVVVGKILMAALSRTDMPQDERKDFYLYIDEFQNYITDSIAVILSEARKYKLDLTIAHQYIGQLVKNNDTTIRDAVFGNVGTFMSFKIGVEDAETMAKEYAPVFNEYDVVNIEKFNAYVKLLVDNESTKAFNMHCFPLSDGNRVLAEQIKQLSKLKYGRDKAVVESEIKKRLSKSFTTLGADTMPTGEKFI